MAFYNLNTAFVILSTYFFFISILFGKQVRGSPLPTAVETEVGRAEVSPQPRGRLASAQR